TRYERVLKQPNEPPLPKGHTSRSEEGRMEPFELMDIVPPTPHDSPLPGGYIPGSDKSRLKLEELMAMYVVPTGRVVVSTGRYVVPAGRVLSPGSDNESDDASVHSEATIAQQQQNIQPQIITTVSNNNAKFPYLKKDEYEVWAMKMEYWITNNDMNIWKVIQNGNSLKRTGRDRDGRVIILPPTTADEHIAVQRESKARTTLLQSIPDDHVADFHYMDDARDIWNAVKARFGGNAESKKMRKSMLKQEFSEFRISEAEGLHKGYDRMQKILSQLNQLKAKPEDEDINLKFLRALPSSWSQVALTLKTKGGLELLSFDDLYYKLKTLEVDIKGYSTFSSSQSAGPSHSAFVSTTSASKKMSYADSPSYSSSTYTAPSNSKTGSHRSGNVIEDVLQSFVADTEPEQQLAYEDFEQIEKMDLEEMDLKWQMAMLSVRVHKFEQKAGRKIDFDKKESARFNKKKVRCYKCLQRGHFARECRAKGGNDKQRYSSFKIQEIGKKEEDSKALITVDTLVDWTEHDGQSDGVIAPKEFGMIAGCDTEDAIEEGAAKIYNLITGADTKEASTAGDAGEFALMGVTSEVHNCPFGCDNKYNELQKQHNELNEQNSEYFIQVQAYKNSLKTLEKQKRVLQKNQLTLEDKIRVLSIELENTTNLLKHSERINAIAETAKKELQTKLDNHLVQIEKWRTSSKNLFRLIDSSMSVRTKVGLGFNNYIRENELGWDDSAFSVFTTNSEEVEGRPLFNRFAKADSMKVVPPPLSGDYTPLSDHIDLDESQMSYGTKSSTSGDSNSVSNDFVSCDNSDKSSEVNTNDFASSDSSVKSSEPKSNDSTSCASTSSVSTSESEAEIESNVGTPIQEPIIIQDLPSFSCNSSDKNENTSRTSCNKNGYFNKKANKIVGNKVGPVHSRNNVNHQNQFVPQAVLLKTGKVNIPPASPQLVSTGNQRCLHQFLLENPYSDAEDEGIFDSGCSRSMTGNMERLDDFQEFQGGKVTFGGGEGSDDYHQILDFLRASHIRSPELGPPAILATIDETPYTITEDSVRSQLQLADDGGIDDLPIAKIYSGIDNLGYVTKGKLTFYKNKFSPQWRFLVHTILHCLSTKSSSWDQFGSSLVVSLICLSDGRKFNWSSYIFKGMVNNIGNDKKFLMYPRFLQTILAQTLRGNYALVAAMLPKIKKHGQSSDPNIASFSRVHETDDDPFTSTKVEDEPLGGSFHASPPRSTQAPHAGHTSGGAKDLITLTVVSFIVSTLMQNVNHWKMCQGHQGSCLNVVGKLVKKVKAMEVKLKTKKRKVVVSDSDQEEGGEQDVDLDALLALANAAVIVDSNIPPGGASSSYIPTDVPTGVAPAGVSNKGKTPMVEEDITVKERTLKQMEDDRLGEEAAKRLHDEEQA
ncbi:putative ribonuclease H-like domain-containing protein, partial [Tanacetum coccineum]